MFAKVLATCTASLLQLSPRVMKTINPKLLDTVTGGNDMPTNYWAPPFKIDGQVRRVSNADRIRAGLPPLSDK
jgi:hypothetical protein